MNVKCFNCGVVHNTNFCPNCGAPVYPQNQNNYFNPKKKGISAGAIVAIVFGSIFAFFIFIIFMFIIFANITNRSIHDESSIVDESTSEGVKEISYFELSQGEYSVGSDVPTATYDISGISGWGFIYIYKNETLYELDIVTDIICLYDGENENLSNMYTEEYKNLKLKKGQYIKIENTVVVGFTAK